MATNNRKGPIIDPGICRCCGSLKKCRLLNVEYEWIGQKEIYSDMFMDTFGLLLSNLDGEAVRRLICATCVTRLRDASAFRKQVLCCEETLLQAQLETETGLQEIKEEIDLNEQKQELEPLRASVADDENDEDKDIGDDCIADNDLTTQQDDLPAEITKKEPPQKSKRKLKKRDKSKPKQKLKSKEKKSRVIKRKKINSKKSIIAAMKEIEDSLEGKEIQLIDLPPKSRPKPTEMEQQNLHNTITIVENSLVCPFDTSFSDYYCFYCRQTFTDPTILRNHTETHDPLTFKQIINNKKLIQIDITRLECRLCSKSIVSIDNLKEHLVKDHGKVIYTLQNEFLKFRLTNNSLRCTECNVSFSFFHALKKHMAEHFGTCICDVCGAHYFEERMLILHQKTHQKIVETFPCSECGKDFKSKHSRYLHEARTHKKEPAYQCPKCDEVLFSYSLRYRHMIEIHGEHRTFQCTHCERNYDSRKSLREHTRRFHLKIFKHQCDLCEKRFYIPSRLKEHLATHTGERNFRCDLCGKSYPRLRGLKVHLQSHNSEKKFRCVLCSASFTQNVNLKNHMKRQHQGLDFDETFNEAT